MARGEGSCSTRRKATGFRPISLRLRSGGRVRIERMKTLDPTGITWSLTRTGALVRAEARGHIFGGKWTEQVRQDDSMQSQSAYSVTHCGRCGAALLAESTQADDPTNPAIDADCLQSATSAQ